MFPFLSTESLTDSGPPLCPVIMDLIQVLEPFSGIFEGAYVQKQ